MTQFRALTRRTFETREALAYADLKVVCSEVPNLAERARWLVIWKLYLGFRQGSSRLRYWAETKDQGPDTQLLVFYAEPLSHSKEEEDEFIEMELGVLNDLV